jgi:acetylornithine deacetylase/succinyl-diaminopimelate desuccinylase-like protein
VAGLLSELIRLDTVNPPGNETRAADLLRSYLEENGVECELYAKVPERANLVARIPGTGEGPRLALLSHTDTVLADPAEWQVDPWSGELRDGEIWGRGALDMKGQVAASAVALASLARDEFRPSGDLIFVAAADEEVGVDFGLAWLCREHPDAVQAEYSLNEGAGDRIEIVGSKGTITFACFETTPIRLWTAAGTQEFPEPTPEHVQQPLIQTVVDELRGVPGASCPSTGETAARTSWVADQILRAWRERG